jgi:multidrug efflux pump subunit AcrB
VRNAIRFLVERSLVVHVVSVLLVALGIFAALKINREAFPNVNLDRIQIEVSYPGATPIEVERLVITPIEQELKSLDGIDRMISVSYPGSGRITLELDPYASNRDRLAADTQLAVERADLPQDLPEEPKVTEIDGAVFPILRLAIGAPRSELEMKRLGDAIRDDLLEVEGVARVVIQGARKAEIRVTVDPERLARQRISIGEIAEALANWNVNAPGGELDTPGGQKQVRISGEFRDARDAANVVLRANERGEGIRLGEIARVTEALEKPRVLYDVSGEPGVAMLVLKRSNADIITTVDNVDRYVETVAERYGRDVTVKKFQDFSRFARLRLGVLTNNGMVGIVLVFITLLVFLRPSVALTATWGLPIIVLSGLYVLYLSGITLNMISMFGFIMVLGMLVDDAIIIGENITYHMERGMKPVEAAVQGTLELLGPVTATVMTTIVAFLPLAFMSGIIGKFVIAIPVVVSLLLFFSWLESFLMLPSHVADVTDPHRHPPERRWLVRLEESYGRGLERAVRHRWLALAVAVAVLAGSIVLARKVMPFELFPPAGLDQLIVRASAPPGVSIEDMRGQLRQLDGALRAAIAPEYLEATVIGTGEIAIDEGDPLTQRGDRFGQIRALYTPAVTRPDHDVLADLRRLVQELPPRFPKLELAFTEIRHGPPTGRPLEAELSGADAALLEGAARRLIAMLQKVPGVVSVDSGLKAGDEELHVVLDRALATYAGVDLATAARHVRAAVGGLVVSTTRRGTEEIDVTIRYPENGARELLQLKSLLVPNRRGGLVPLARLARFEERMGYTTIRHKAGIRVVQVVADIDSALITSVALNRLAAEREREWLGEAAGKVRVNYGGEAEKNVESFRGLVVSFVFALLAIFVILAIQFNNLGYPIVVMLAIPFGIVGIILSFYAHHLLWKPMPLSFFSTMGMVALSGVVVNTSLVLLVFIQRARQQGAELLEAIVTAGRRRLRAIIITAATTVMGLLPTAYGWGGLDPFVSPMALALGWGLLFATLITLFVIPAALAAAVDVKRGVGKLVRRERRDGHTK